MPRTTTAPARLIPLTTVHNLRDLGGYPTSDGRTTRWRMLYRADGLYRLGWAGAEGVADDLAVVEALGLHTVLDLRTEGELATWGRFPVEVHPVLFHHVPLMDVTWERDDTPDPALPLAEVLLGKYLELLDEAEPQLARAFALLAQPGALPAVFHCAAGKDRTGLLAALLLGALGVPDAVVVDDYALTAPAMDRMRAWAERTDPQMAAAFASQPAAHLAAEPAAVEGLLQLLRDVHGTPRDYVRSLGVTNAVLFALEDALLEG
jgi:protein-tyrosine phosphatase